MHEALAGRGVSCPAPPGSGRCPSVSTGHQRRPKTMSDVPAIDTRENTPGPVPSRRSFLARAAGASAVALPALTLLSSSRAQAKAKPKPKPGQPNKLTGLTATLLQEIM